MSMRMVRELLCEAGEDFLRDAQSEQELQERIQLIADTRHPAHWPKSMIHKTTHQAPEQIQ